ncbi:MAG: amidohydrolase family protein, partial [Caldilineaceae bacterium]|nr:amidohydrolase family protein [Caldilineaceae bacterium]
MQPTLLLVNGNIHTMERLLPRASALAIAGAQILAVGGDELAALAGRTTRVIDLHGLTVVPGLIDAHLHFLSYGLSLREIDLMNVPSR